MSIFHWHKWATCEDEDHFTICGKNYRYPIELKGKLLEQYPKGYCPMSIKVCKTCGEASAYGSHGKISFVPDGCSIRMVEYLRLKYGHSDIPARDLKRKK